MKPIRFSMHARENLSYRGSTDNEVIEAIRNSPWSSVLQGRFECRKNFAYEREWNGKFYAMKQVRPIFVEEPEGIVVITVYVYYFNTET